MDNRLKQRLIGAAVLVALAVIIVPELVNKTVNPDKPAVTTAIPPRPAGPESPNGEANMSFSLPSTPASNAEERSTALPKAASEEKPQSASVAVDEPVPPVMTEDKPIGQTFTPLVPTPAPPLQAVEVTEPVTTGEPEKAKTRLSKAKTAKEEANKAVATTRTAEVTKTETAKEGTAKVKVAREEAAKPKVAKEETSRAGEAAKKTEMAKIETVKAETLSSAMTKAQTTKPAEAAKVEPAKSIELPKIELISRPETPAVTPPQPPTKMARVESKAQTSVPTAVPPSTNKSTTGPHSGWMIQAGSFSVLENANLLRDKLRGQNFSAYVESTTVGGRTLYRVRVGPQASQMESKAIAARLRREAGINAQVIPQND